MIRELRDHKEAQMKTCAFLFVCVIMFYRQLGLYQKVRHRKMKSTLIPTLDEQTAWSLPYHPCVRLGSWDINIFSEQPKYAPLNIEPYSTVLDLGANIGAFALWAFHNGAGTVHCYEPESENEALLRFNLRGKNAYYYPFAISGQKTKQLNIYAGRNGGMHSLIANPSLELSKQVEVYTHDLERALWLTRSDTMKMDIEYSELYLEWECLKIFTNLKRFVVEWHFALGKEYKHQALRCHDTICNSGYAPYGTWEIAESGESVLGFYERVK